MSFLKDENWGGQVYSGGWITPEGGDAAVIEPATDASSAAPASPPRPTSPGRSSRPPPPSQPGPRASVQELYEAATLPSRPYGELLPSEQPRLSFAERVPVGVVGVISPFNFPQILSVRSVAPALALGNALGPIIDARQRDKIHALVTGSTGQGARLAAGGTYEGLFYKPTVLADVTTTMPAYANEVFGPVAPVLRFSNLAEAAAIAAETEYGLSLGILTRDVMRGLELARRIPTGIVHINDQTVNDEPNSPFGGIFDSGTGTRFGGTANLDAFTETRWVTIRGEIAPYPF